MLETIPSEIPKNMSSNDKKNFLDIYKAINYLDSDPNTFDSKKLNSNSIDSISLNISKKVKK